MLRHLLKKQPRRIFKNEAGQALIEFIMLIPIIMSLIWYLIHVSLAINKSIVGQKHARSQLFLKMYNHRSGPVVADFGRTQRSMYYLGVSGTTDTDHPVAPTEMLGLGPKPTANANANDNPDEAALGTLRQNVRVRSVFGICTHRKLVANRSRQTDFCGSDPDGG